MTNQVFYTNFMNYILKDKQQKTTKKGIHFYFGTFSVTTSVNNFGHQYNFQKNVVSRQLWRFSPTTMQPPLTRLRISFKKEFRRKQDMKIFLRELFYFYLNIFSFLIEFSLRLYKRDQIKITCFTDEVDVTCS